MKHDIDLIKKEIADKNKLLNKLDANKNSDKSKIQILKVELDRLLYVYYKSLIRGTVGVAF